MPYATINKTGETMNPSQIDPLPLQENARGGTGEREVEAGENLNIGDIVRISNADPTNNRAIAVKASATSPVVGGMWVVVSAGVTGDQVAVTQKTARSMNTTGYAAQSLVYLSDTAGQMSLTAGTNSRVIGFVLIEGAEGLVLLETDNQPSSSASSQSYDIVRQDIPNTNQGNNTIEYEGYVSVASTLSQIVVYMKTKNTQGGYTATFTNLTTGNTLLNAANYDMQTITADTWTVLTLTGTAGDLAFAPGNRFRAAFTSNDLNFDGTGIYFNLRFTVT